MYTYAVCVVLLLHMKTCACCRSLIKRFIALFQVIRLVSLLGEIKLPSLSSPRSRGFQRGIKKCAAKCSICHIFPSWKEKKINGTFCALDVLHGSDPVVLINLLLLPPSSNVRREHSQSKFLPLANYSVNDGAFLSPRWIKRCKCFWPILNWALLQAPEAPCEWKLISWGGII